MVPSCKYIESELPIHHCKYETVCKWVGRESEGLRFGSEHVVVNYGGPELGRSDIVTACVVKHFIFRKSFVDRNIEERVFFLSVRVQGFEF